MVWVFGVFLVGCEKFFWFSSLSLTGNTNLQKNAIDSFHVCFSLSSVPSQKHVVFIKKQLQHIHKNTKKLPE